MNNVTEELVRQNGNQAAAVMADYAGGSGGGESGLQPINITIREHDADCDIFINGEFVVTSDNASVSLQDDSGGRAKLSCEILAENFEEFVSAVVEAAGLNEASELANNTYPVIIRHININNELENGISGFFYRGGDGILYACGVYAFSGATNVTGRYGVMMVEFYGYQ